MQSGSYLSASKINKYSSLLILFFNRFFRDFKAFVLVPVQIIMIELRYPNRYKMQYNKSSKGYSTVAY